MPELLTCRGCFGPSSPTVYAPPQAQISVCSFCDDGSVPTWPASTWEVAFTPLVELYRPSEDVSFPPIHDQLAIDWPVFSADFDSDKRRALLTSIFPTGYPLLASEHVEAIRVGGRPHRRDAWDRLAREVSLRNRYFPNIDIDLDTLRRELAARTRTLSAGHQYFRARHSASKLAFSSGEMGPPPREQASGGRANPHGIPHLYLAKELETCIAEIRPTAPIYVYVARFKTLRNVTVLDLCNVSPIDPFVDSDSLDIEVVDIHRLVLGFANDLGKPVRRSTIGTEYLASQYICEFIKSIGIDGVMYRSAATSDGTNLVLFNSELVQASSMVTQHFVSGVKYEYDLP